MNKKEIIKEIRDVIEGRSAMQYIVIGKEGRSWKIQGSGVGQCLRENLGEGDMLFRHDRNECTLKKAEEIFEVERYFFGKEVSK